MNIGRLLPVNDAAGLLRWSERVIIGRVQPLFEYRENGGFMNTMFQKGVNLGGWLSQYEKWDREHFESFIKKEDLERIREWGFDHVRLPVDCTLFMTQEGKEIAGGISFVDRCLEWAKELGIGILLDLHRAPGYSLDNIAGNDLFCVAQRQELYLEIWKGLSARYREYGEELRFELLNEAHDQNPYRPNRLARRAVEEVRKIDADRILLIGGYQYNHVDALSQLWVLEDEKIVYNFHYYEPNPFTNQGYEKVHGFPEPRYDAVLSYPGNFPGYEAYLRARPDRAEEYGKFAFIMNDRNYMEKNIRKAVDFKRFYGRQVYCGEFGVVFYARSCDRINWVKDLTGLLSGADIGWAYWTYKGMDYGLVDEKGKIIHEGLVEALTGCRNAR